MSIARRIELQIAALTVIGGALFGLGGASPILPVGLLLAAVLGTWQAETRRRFALPGAAVNGLIFVIAILSAWRLASAYGTGEVIILGEAFGGLQAVLLLERKTARTRWDLFSLSLLTVVFSTGLVQGPLYALGLTAYCSCTLATLALICLEGARLRTGGTGSKGQAMAAAKRVRGSWWRLLGIAVSTTIVGPLALFLRFPERVTADQGAGGTSNAPRRAAGRGGPLGEQAVWQAVSTGTEDAAAVEAEFWWRIGRTTLTTIVVAAILFCLAPRFGRMEFELPPLGDLPWRPGPSRPIRVVGFTDRVRLGEMGSLSEDQRMVFEFQLFEVTGERPYQAQGSLYVRGAVLNRYRDGDWAFAEAGPMGRLRSLASESPSDGRTLVRERITVEPSDSRDLFCIWPFLLVGESPPLRFDARSERIHRPRDMYQRSYTLEVATTAFREGVQSPWMASEDPAKGEVYLDWPAENLPGLARLARRWLDEAQIPEDDPTARARLLEGRLLDPGRFRYSLEKRPPSGAGDPIEEFVTRGPEGNCEYFASALALMLRSQGIPSRLIVGFRTDEYSELSETYRARQSHAHAWVEAYVPADRIPAGAARKDGIFDWSQGAWLRLDPSPPLSLRPTGVAGLTRQVENWFTLIHSFWRDHVLSMSATRQQEALYRPLVVQVGQAADDLINPAAWDATRTQKLLGWAVWLVWCVGAAGCTLAAVIWLLRLRVRWGWRGARRMRPDRRGPGSANGRPPVAFYRRFEAILARCGYVRTASQTPHEFAEQAGERIATACGDGQVAAWSRQIVQAFYEVRFGAGTLAGDRTAAVEAALERLGQAARRKPVAPPASRAPHNRSASSDT